MYFWWYLCNGWKLHATRDYMALLTDINRVIVLPVHSQTKVLSQAVGWENWGNCIVRGGETEFQITNTIEKKNRWESYSSLFCILYGERWRVLSTWKSAFYEKIESSIWDRSVQKQQKDSIHVAVRGRKDTWSKPNH